MIKVSFELKLYLGAPFPFCLGNLDTIRTVKLAFLAIVEGVRVLVRVGNSFFLKGHVLLRHFSDERTR